MKHLLSIGILSWLIAAVGLSGANISVTLDFEDIPVPSGGTLQINAPYYQNGFMLTTGEEAGGGSGELKFEAIDKDFPFGGADSTSLIQLPTTDSVILTQNDGNPFDLISIDFDHITQTLNKAVIEVTGQLAGGGPPLILTFETDTVTGSMQTVAFTGWTNLSSVTWFNVSGISHFDNIQLEIVPELSGFSLYLGMTAFGVCVYFRKRRA